MRLCVLDAALAPGRWRKPCRRREGVAASVGKDDAAVAAEGEVCEVVADKVFRRKASDRICVGLYARRVAFFTGEL